MIIVKAAAPCTLESTSGSCNSKPDIPLTALDILVIWPPPETCEPEIRHSLTLSLWTTTACSTTTTRGGPATSASWDHIPGHILGEIILDVLLYSVAVQSIVEFTLPTTWICLWFVLFILRDFCLQYFFKFLFSISLIVIMNERSSLNNLSYLLLLYTASQQLLHRLGWIIRSGRS